MKKLRSIYPLIILLCTLINAEPFFASSPKKRGKDAVAINQQLIDRCLADLWSRHYEDLRADGDSLRKIGAEENNQQLTALGTAFILRGSTRGIIIGDNAPLVRDLTTFDKRMTEKGDTTSLTYYFLQSALARYYLHDQVDYTRAAGNAFQALRCAERLDNKDFEIDALNLISAVFFLKEDDERGWDYAVRSQHLAESVSNTSGIYSASINMANYLYNKHEYGDALQYLLKGQKMMDKAGLENEHAYVESFLGDIYCHLDNPREAEKHYLIALDQRFPAWEYDRGYARMCYAEFLTLQNRSSEALAQLNILEKGIDPDHRPNYYVHLLNQLARTYENAGRPTEALKYYHLYMDEQDRLITDRKEKTLDALESRYKIVQTQNESMRKSLELAEKDQRLIIAWVIVGLLVLVAIFLWLLIRRTKRHYRAIVDRTLVDLKKQTLIEKQLKEALKTAQQPKGSFATEGANGENLFARVRQLMEEEFVYRDPNLSIESLAAKAGTNRTYLSRIINERAGVSYSSFVNEYRLNEIIRALSDPKNTQSLKEIGFNAGFATIANFYRLFRERVGVSPAVFRKNALS